MKFLSLLKKLFSLVFFLFFVSHLCCVPTNNFYDSAIIYDYKGSDKFYSFTKKSNFKVFVSPYYQGVSGCRGLDGKRGKTFTITEEGTESVKFGEGDRLGMWNMLGVLFGSSAAPTDKPFKIEEKEYKKTDEPFVSYNNLALGYIVLDANKNTKVDAAFTAQETQDSKVDKDSSPEKLDLNLTDEKNFNPESKLGRLSVPIDFEKVGLRMSFCFDLGTGAGMKVKTGFCNYKQNPKFVDFSGDVPTTPDDRAKLVQRYLTSEAKIKSIAKELGLDVSAQSENGLEDTHFEFYLNYPVRLEDKDGDHAASLIPYLSFGVWAPTGLKSDQNTAFSLPTGNDGYSGVTLDAALNVNFPGTIQIGFGGGGAFFASRSFRDFRVPSNKYQYGIYPWKTEVRKRPGATWYANFSFMAENFSETFSFYLDYIATWHRKDSIKLAKSRKDPTTGAEVFYPQKLEDESNWRCQTFFSGLNYKIAPGHEIGVCFQSVVGGARVYRSTTIMTTMTLNF